MSSLVSNVRIGTLNVRGLSSRRKQFQLRIVLTDNGIDILAIEESKIESDEDTARMLAPFLSDSEVCVSHANGTSGGCLLFIKKAISAKDHCVTVDGEGRLIVCDFRIVDNNYRVICVYAPTNEKERKLFFEAVKNYLDCQRKVVVLVDFNCVCSAKDRSGKIRRDSSAEFLSLITNEFNLQDVAEYQRSISDMRYTHFQSSSDARHDSAYVCVELLTGNDDYKVVPIFFSDHAHVSFALGRMKTELNFRWNTWKFNNKLLVDDVFNARAESILSKMGEKHCSPTETWGIGQV